MEEIILTTHKGSHFMKWLTDNIDTINKNKFYIRVEYGKNFSLESKKINLIDEQESKQYLISGDLDSEGDFQKEREKYSGEKGISMPEREKKMIKKKTLQDEDIDEDDDINEVEAKNEMDKKVFDSILSASGRNENPF